MMTESERRGSPKNRWTRWYMWLAYGGGVLIVAVVVIVAMAAAPSGDGETMVSHHNTATVSHQHTLSDAELEDLQFVADAKGITLEQAIERYGWRDDFAAVVTAIRDDDPDGLVDAAITGASSAHIEFSGSISGGAQDAIDNFKSENPGVAISVQTGLGLTGREVEDAVVGAHFAVLDEDGVQDSVTYFDSDANEIVVIVQMANPPSDEKQSSLEKAAERGATEATRPDITDSLTISLSVVQHDLGGTEGYRAPN